MLGVLDGSDVEVGGFEPGQGHRHVRDGPEDDLGVEMFSKILKKSGLDLLPIRIGSLFHSTIFVLTIMDHEKKFVLHKLTMKVLVNDS